MENQIPIQNKKKSKLYLVIGISLGIFVVIFGISQVLGYVNNSNSDKKTIDVNQEKQGENTVSTQDSHPNPTYLDKIDTSKTILDKRFDSKDKITLNLEAGRYLLSFAPDADILAYKEGKKLYASIKTSKEGDYYFDINKNEPNTFIIEVNPHPMTHIMLVETARFK